MDIPVVIVEHDMQVVMDIADRIYVLELGQRDRRGGPGRRSRGDPEVIQAYLGEGRCTMTTSAAAAEKTGGSCRRSSRQGVDTLPQLLSLPGHALRR